MAVLLRSTKRDPKSLEVVEVGVLLAAVVVENVVAVGIRVGSMHDCKGHSLVSGGSITDGSLEPRGADVTRHQRRTTHSCIITKTAYWLRR